MEQWGFDPASVTSIATCVAMIAAVSAGLFAYLTYREMREQSRHAKRQTEAVTGQLERDQQLERRRHAEAVHVWTEVVAEDAKDDSGEMVYGLRLCALNTSSAPVFDLYVGIDLGTNLVPDVWYGCVRSLLAARGNAEPQFLNVSPQTYADWIAWKASHPKNPQPRVEIVFRDSLGQSWIRSSFGELSMAAEEGVEKPWWVDRRSKALAG